MMDKFVQKKITRIVNGFLYNVSRFTMLNFQTRGFDSTLFLRKATTKILSFQF